MVAAIAAAIAVTIAAIAAVAAAIAAIAAIPFTINAIATVARPDVPSEIPGNICRCVCKIGNATLIIKFSLAILASPCRNFLLLAFRRCLWLGEAGVMVCVLAYGDGGGWFDSCVARSTMCPTRSMVNCFLAIRGGAWLEPVFPLFEYCLNLDSMLATAGAFLGRAPERCFVWIFVSLLIVFGS